jgi:hypothetical protein
MGLQLNKYEKVVACVACEACVSKAGWLDHYGHNTKYSDVACPRCGGEKFEERVARGIRNPNFSFWKPWTWGRRQILAEYKAEAPKTRKKKS